MQVHALRITIKLSFWGTLADLHTTLSNGLRQLEMWSDLWSVTFNAAKTQVLTITLIHPSSSITILKPSPNSNCFSQASLRLIFHWSLTWHLHISTLHHRAMSTINTLKKIKNFLPRYSQKSAKSDEMVSGCRR